jgi:hypothetical protein
LDRIPSTNIPKSFFVVNKKEINKKMNFTINEEKKAIPMDRKNGVKAQCIKQMAELIIPIKSAS